MIRAVRYKDLDAVRAIFETAFREEYGRRGVDIGAQVHRWQRLYPVIRLLACFPNPYRYLLNIHVLEVEGQIAGFIQTSPGNREKTRWHIDFVAVAPAFQGKGLGKQLVEAVFDLYGALGVKCFTLEVDALNAPALGLYGKQGFREYTKMTYFQAETPPVPVGTAVEGLRDLQAGDEQGLYELFTACTPAPVRLVDTRKPGDFAVGSVEKGMIAVRRGLNQVADHRFVVVEGERIVGYLRVIAQLRPMPHTLHLMVNPGYDHHYAGLLDHAARILAGFPARTVLAWAPDYQPAKRAALEAWGMKVVTVDCCLVRDNLVALKLPPAEQVAVTDDKLFKPAFVPTGGLE